MCASPLPPAQQTTVTKTISHSEKRIVDENAVIPPYIIVKNCPDVHIGPKYVRNNNLIINRTLGSEPLDLEIDEKNYLGSLIHKCTNVSSGIQLKTVLLWVLLLFAICIVVIVTFLIKHEQNRKRLIPQIVNNNEDYPLEKRFVTRESWGAAPPCVELANNTLPVRRVIFIHTASSGTCNTFSACKNIVLDIQDFHKNECTDGPYAVGDIGYNFVIGSDGHIFVGRGWDKIGAHTYGSNSGSIGVAFVGDFRRDEPSPAMLNSAKTLLEVGVARGKLSEEYQLFGHCQLHSGFPYSPGVNVLKKIESWPHWNSTNTDKCANFNYGS